MLLPVAGPDEPGSVPATEGYRWCLIAILLIVGVLAYFATVGADCLWLVALGDRIREQGHVPDGIPFAAGALVGLLS